MRQMTYSRYPAAAVLAVALLGATAAPGQPGPPGDFPFGGLHPDGEFCNGGGGGPYPRGVVGHPGCGQKLVQVAAHRPVVIAGGRAEVGQKDADLGARDLGVIGGGVRRAYGI